MNPNDEARCIGQYSTWLNGGWSTQGPITGSPANGVLADTGALEAGYYDASFIIYNSAVTLEVFSLAHRNAANTADLKNQWIILLTATSCQFDWLKNYKIGANERLRITNINAEANALHASIFWSRRA